MAKLTGQLTPEQQLKVLSRIWGLDRDGYVFLPWIDGHARNKEERKKGFHEGRAYPWPKDRPGLLKHLKDHQHDELYFPPNVFNGKRRIEENVHDERVLYADLDPVDPRGLGANKPTIAWESSPGRYQGVWLLDRPKVGATWASKENHRLTVALGADPSGWDSTQLLRVPGRPNYKPEYKDANNGEPVSGKGLMWFDGPRYVWSDFDDLPEVGAVANYDESLKIDDKIITEIDRHALWAKVRLKLPTRIREYMALKEVPSGVDRSDVLWDINREMADIGLTIAEIVALVRQTVWNKFSSRSDEMAMLKKQAAKAVDQVEVEPDTLEATPDEEPKPGIIWLNDLAQETIPRPKWLIKDIWTKGGLGFISGAPKSYKSWMALDMAVSIATGTPFLNQPGFAVREPLPVLYLQEEDDLRLVMDRLGKIVEGKVPEAFWHGQISTTGEYTGDVDSPSVVLEWTPPTRPIPMALHVHKGFVASDEGWQAWLDDIIGEGKFAMVIIDTLGTTAGEVDTDKSGELMTKMLRPLRVISNKHDAAICVIHHNKKASNQGGRAGQDMLGSTALHAWVECAIYARSKDAHGEIGIEREAKLAMDMSMRIRIPEMYEDHRTGERVLWDPEVITEGLETVQDAPMHNDPTPPSQRTDAGSAGSKLTWKLKQMGKGPFTFEEIMERFPTNSPGSIHSQLESGVDNGMLELHTDGRWSVVRK